MKGKEHQISDKRKIKLVIYEVKDVNQDIALQEVNTYTIGKASLKFDTPNSTALYLSASNRELKQAKHIYSSLIEPKLKKRESFELSDVDTANLYDYFEYIKMSIIMAYTAVECLCNALIPRDFSYYERHGDGDRLWDNAEIQRWKSTTQKLRQILPKALNMKDPGQFKCYATFAKLEMIRNEIIHTRSVLPIEIIEQEKLYSQLLQSRIFNLVKSAELLIKELQSALPYNKEMPILYNTEPIEKIKINSWDDLKLTKASD